MACRKAELHAHERAHSAFSSVHLRVGSSTRSVCSSHGRQGCTKRLRTPCAVPLPVALRPVRAPRHLFAEALICQHAAQVNTRDRALTSSSCRLKANAWRRELLALEKCPCASGIAASLLAFIMCCSRIWLYCAVRRGESHLSDIARYHDVTRWFTISHDM